MLPSEEYKRKLEQIDEDENEKLKQPVSEFPSAFACVPWGHHVRIVQHSETIEEALFYVGYTKESWGRFCRSFLPEIFGGIMSVSTNNRTYKQKCYWRYGKQE